MTKGYILLFFYTDMDTFPQPATSERKPPPHKASFQQEFPPLTKLHQNQQMRHQPGNRRQQRHASRLLAIAKIRQQIQEINRFPVLEPIQKHEVNKSCMQRKTQHQHKHADKQRQKYKSNQSAALKELLRAQQHMLTEGKTIHQKRIGRFAKMTQIMTSLGKRQGHKPPLQQNQDTHEQMSLKECISKSKHARLDRLRQKLFEKRSKHRLLELNKQFTTTKQNLLTMEQRALQNQVDHLEKQLQVENEDMTEEINVQTQDNNENTKNLNKESHGKQLGNRGQEQNRDEWINRIKDTLESGSTVALQQDKREGQRQANVSQSKQKKTDQRHQPQDTNEDKRQNWIGRIKDTLSKGVPHRRQGEYVCSGEKKDQSGDKQVKTWSTLERQETKQMRLRQKKRNKELHDHIQGLSFRSIETETNIMNNMSGKDSGEQDVVQRELEITKRLIDRNTRNLQHYKQTFGKTPQHNMRKSSQQDTVGQKRMAEKQGSNLKPAKDELSNNLSQIIRNTEKLKEYIRTRKENDSSVLSDTKRMSSLVIEDPSKTDSAIIQRELDQTKRQIERNARNLQHYKQTFGETPQHQPQTSSQQDTTGQTDDKSAQFKSSSTCNKVPQSLTLSGEKAKRRITTIVISDDEEDDHNSTSAKRKKCKFNKMCFADSLNTMDNHVTFVDYEPR